MKKDTYSVSNTPMESSTRTFHRDCVLCYSANVEDTILAGGVSRESQSSPLRFFVESTATDHQEVSSFFTKETSAVGLEPAT